MNGSYIPSEKELEQTVKLVEVNVEGEYIARIDEKRKTTRAYKVTVQVQEGHNKSDIKRLVPAAIREKHEDFVSMRTFYPKGKPKATSEKCKLKDLYNDMELARFAKQRLKRQKELDALAHDEDIDPNTGMPHFVD